MEHSIQSPIYSLKDLEMPDDEPMVIIRSSLLWICDGDKYAAAVLNMYVHWTRWLMKHKPVAQKINQMLKKQGKTATQVTTFIIYRKQAELVEDLLHFCNEKRLRQANALLVSKGLLKIEDIPRHIADHTLKYELQIAQFKESMGEWRKYREENNLTAQDESVEVALDEESDGTDNSPFRSRQFTDSASSRNGQFTDRRGQITAPKRIDDSEEIIRDNKERGSTHNHNAQSLSEVRSTETPSQETSNAASPTAEGTRGKTPNACLDSRKVTQVFPEHLSEKERQIVSWFNEVVGTGKTNLTRSALECLSIIAPEIETKEDVRGLYNQAKKDIEARGDAKNKVVYLANLKDALVGWKQNKPDQQHPTSEKVFWTRYSGYQGFTTSIDLWFLFEFMTQAEAKEYGIEEYGELGNKKVYQIKVNRAKTTEETRLAMIEQWVQGSLKIAG